MQLSNLLSEYEKQYQQIKRTYQERIILIIQIYKIIAYMFDTHYMDFATHSYKKFWITVENTLIEHLTQLEDIKGYITNDVYGEAKNTFQLVQTLQEKYKYEILGGEPSKKKRRMI